MGLEMAANICENCGRSANGDTALSMVDMPMKQHAKANEDIRNAAAALALAGQKQDDTRQDHDVGQVARLEQLHNHAVAHRPAGIQTQDLAGHGRADIGA